MAQALLDIFQRIAMEPVWESILLKSGLALRGLATGGSIEPAGLDALVSAGLPAIAFPPSGSVIAQDGKVVSWDLSPIQSALQAGLLPVVYGDVVFDTLRGGTILSTEDLFRLFSASSAPAAYPSGGDRIRRLGGLPGTHAIGERDHTA